MPQDGDVEEVSEYLRQELQGGRWRRGERRGEEGGRRTVPQDSDVEEVSEYLRQELQGRRWRRRGEGGGGQYHRMVMLRRSQGT